MTTDKRTLYSIILFFTAIQLFSADWPMWKHDASRSGKTDEKLPATLNLQWKRELGTPRPAWPPSQVKLQFDRSFEPVVVGKTIYIPSMNSDKITAYDTDSGKELWRFYADGPVRFAPVIYKNKIYFASDDGILYCLNAQSGKLIRKTSLAPNRKKILGNKRMISIWPARGGAALLDGKVYAAAGIWPFMGTFIYSIDAETGKIVWCNSGSGSIFIEQQHFSPAFAGVAPQGYIAATKNKLLISGGRTVPAIYDIKTGKFLYYHISDRTFTKGGGGYAVSTTKKYFSNGSSIYDLSTGKCITQTSAEIMTDKLFLALNDNGEISAKEYLLETFKQKRSKRKISKSQKFKELWKQKTSPVPDRILLNTADRLFCSTANGNILSFNLKKRPTSKEVWRADWQYHADSKIWNIIAADHKLFAVTEKGTIYCFGENKGNKTYALTRSPLQSSKSESEQTITKILNETKQKSGYCLVYGIGSGDIIRELIRKTDMHIVVIACAKDDIYDFRRKMDNARIYGERVAVFAGKIADLPSYFANLAIVNNEEVKDKKLSTELMRILRPYGGKAFFMNSGKKLERKGPLAGAGSWTHQYGDAGNSVVSKDKLVRLPLGILWFGGPSNDKILPRHGHGPAPQVINGRLFIEGRNILRAVDVYTGRLLWEKEILNLGKFYDNTSHQPGANMIGSNYVSAEDAIYVITPDNCLMLSPETGAILKKLTLPNAQKWGFIATEGNYLVAASTPLKIPIDQKKSKKRKTTKNQKDTYSSDIQENVTELIKRNAVWKYLAGGQPESDWKTTEKVKDNWRSSQAGFGYGDGDDKTVLKDMRGKYSNIYIRKKFNFTVQKLPESIILKIRYDDAFIAYLNGKEVARRSISSTGKVSSHEAGKNFQSIKISLNGNLKRENNILAIEGFNTGVGSSDLTLDPYLVCKTVKTENKTALANKKQPSVPIAFSHINDVTVDADYASGSEKISVLNRHSGKLLWSRDAVYNFRHNAIIIAKDTLFCIDRLTEKKLSYLRRHGYSNKTKPVLYALDLKTGKVKWKTDKEIFGTWLGYSQKYNILIEAQSHARDRAFDEPTKGLAAFNADTGQVIWKKNLTYDGPCMLHKDTIIAQEKAFDLLTGKNATMKNPFNNKKQVPWTFKRNYGCNTIIASENLLTFRSAAAGYFDLNTCAGVGNLGGFKSGCTSNLIAADGVLNAPDYTRTCTCSYQNQSSLAMVYMPEVEAWTFSNLSQISDMQKMGLNFGAPGDMVSSSGTLWLELPLAGSPSPNLNCTFDPPQPETFRKHSSLISGKGEKWVAASGIEGIKSIKIDIVKNKICDINLYFSEPEVIHAGKRVFSVRLEGKTVLENLDIFKECNGKNRLLKKSFKGIKVNDSLDISFKTEKGKTLISGIEVIKK